MLRINEWVTTVEKMPYPWSGQIKEIIKKDGLEYFKCQMSDMEGVILEIYSAKDIRHYSAKEFADDIFSYHVNEKAPDINNIYSKEYLDWLRAEIEKQNEGIKAIKLAERIIEDPDYDNFTSAELASMEHMEEYGNCLMGLSEIIECELREIPGAIIRRKDFGLKYTETGVFDIPTFITSVSIDYFSGNISFETARTKLHCGGHLIGCESKEDVFIMLLDSLKGNERFYEVM